MYAHWVSMSYWMYLSMCISTSVCSLPLDIVFDPAEMKWIIFFLPLGWDCLFVRVENNCNKSDCEWSHGDGCHIVLLSGQFEYVLLIGLWRVKLCFSAFLKNCLHDMTMLSPGAAVFIWSPANVLIISNQRQDCFSWKLGWFIFFLWKKRRKRTVEVDCELIETVILASHCSRSKWISSKPSAPLCRRHSPQLKASPLGRSDSRVASKLL